MRLMVACKKFLPFLKRLRGESPKMVLILSHLQTQILSQEHSLIEEDVFRKSH